MWENTKFGAVDVISGAHPINGENVIGLRRLLEQRANDGQPRIVIDFRQIPLIDSHGMELLLDTRDACVRRGGMLQLAGLNPLCLDILRATKVAALFELYDDPVIAAGSFSQ